MKRTKESRSEAFDFDGHGARDLGMHHCEFRSGTVTPSASLTTMSLTQDVLASVFIVVTMPMTIYHSVQAARKSKIEGASMPHVESANWYLRGGPLGESKEISW